MEAPTRQRLKRWIVRAAWAGLILNAILWVLLADVSPQPPALAALLALIQVTGLWLCLGILAIRYRRWVGTGYGLMAAILLLALSRWAIGIETSTLGSTLLILALMTAVAALPLSMALLLWQRDVSVVLIGAVLLAFVWGVSLASRPYGDPIRAWLLATASESGEFWWFDTLSCLLMIALPLGGLAFVAHLARLLILELQRRST